VIDLIAFDADDTLWHDERLYRASEQELKHLLAAYQSTAWVEARLFETEVRNLRHFGYGVKGFTLSMIETAIELTEGRIASAEIGRLVALGKQMLDAPVELLEGVREAVERLSGRYRLVVVTKGDLFHQEAKVARSGLGDFFAGVEIVSTKDRRTYERVAAKYGAAPERFLMVGNSLRSDVLPVLAMGGHAAYVPYPTTWAHEAVTEAERGALHGAARYHPLSGLDGLPGLVDALAAVPAP
jgi:putative hydrolase of the HAD superfamily